MSTIDEHLSVLHVRRLDSGYWHVRGIGPCNWAQPPRWPCDEETLRAHAFREASESFIQAAHRAASLSPLDEQGSREH